MAAQPGRVLRDALDRIVCSSANYWVAMFSDLGAAVAFLAFGLSRSTGHFVVAASIVTFGFLASGLIEYATHRWVLHGPPSVARRGHLQHHADPQALVSAPDDAYSLSILGYLRFRQEKYEEAFDALSRAAQLDPVEALRHT